MTINRNFLKYFFLFLFLFLFFCGFFNFIIDPYYVWGNNQFHQLNHLKNKLGDRERLSKAVTIMKLKPKSVIMGSSRALLGINPEHPSLSLSEKTFNLALSAATMEEIKKYFDHVVANQPELKQVVLGLDFFMFNGLREPNISFDKKIIGHKTLPLRSKLDLLFSIGVLRDSLSTFFFNFSSLPKEVDYKLNGMMDIEVIDKRALQKMGSRLRRFENSLISDFVSNSLEGYQYSYAALNDLEDIISFCHEKGIRLILFISPTHVVQLESIYLGGLWPIFQEWKHDIVKLYPIWDFSGYNSVTMEPISEKMNYYIDDSHYTPLVGSWILSRILKLEDKTIPSDFGVLLTSDNVEMNLKTIESQREKWALQNLEQTKWLKKLKESIRLNPIRVKRFEKYGKNK